MLKKIGWSGGLISDVERGRTANFSEKLIRYSHYRPFTKQFIYFHSQFNERVYRMPFFYPKTDSDNLIICVTGLGATKGFSALITDTFARP